MRSENELMQKLMLSKKIMDVHNNVPRGQVKENYNISNIDNFETQEPKYNIPQEFMMESQIQPKKNSNIPITKDKVMASRLPDEIKRLMIEHPINQPQMQQTSVLSNDLIEKASRLMKNDVANNVSHFKESKPQIKENINSNLETNTLKELIKETIKEVLSENGLLVENTSKSNDLFQFRVGSHIFEGNVTKIKKIK